MKPSQLSWSRGFRASMELCMNINTQSGFQFYGEMVIPDGYLFDPASHQCFIEFCQVCSLLCNEILKVVDALYLLVSCGSVNRGLLTEFAEPENFICDFIIGLFAVCLLQKILLQSQMMDLQPRLF